MVCLTPGTELGETVVAVAVAVGGTDDDAEEGTAPGIGISAVGLSAVVGVAGFRIRLTGTVPVCAGVAAVVVSEGEAGIGDADGAETDFGGGTATGALGVIGFSFRVFRPTGAVLSSGVAELTLCMVPVSVLRMFIGSFRPLLKPGVFAIVSCPS